MPAAIRYFGNLNRSQIEELAKQFPNANINSQWLNLFVKGLVKDAIEGKLADKKKSTKDLLDEQRLKNLRKNGALLDLTIWEKAKNGNVALTITQLGEIGEGKFEIPMPSNMTPQPEKQNTTPQDKQFTEIANTISPSIWNEADNQFVCFECNPKSKFQYRLGVVTEMINVVSDYSYHVLNQHGRSLNENEKKIINEYLDIVNKYIVPTGKTFDELKESLEKNKNG